MAQVAQPPQDHCMIEQPMSTLTDNVRINTVEEDCHKFTGKQITRSLVSEDSKSRIWGRRSY